MPKAVQLRRTKGWRLPPNCVAVDRRTKFGNPYLVFGRRSATRCVALYEAALIAGRKPWARRILDSLHELRGRDLGCWCALWEPCHRQVLLKLANAASDQPKEQPPCK